MRAYHIAYVEEFYESLSVSERNAHGPGILLDFAYDIAIPTITSHPQNNKFLKSNSRTSQHNKARYDEICEEMKRVMAFDAQTGQLPTLRFVEMVYNWGRGEGLLLLMVKLRPSKSTTSEDDRAFKAVYSVARVFYRVDQP